MKPLKIDPKFQSLIPPLSDDEYRGLEESLLAYGQCRDKIKVWKGTIIDGHNRYAICKKHGLPVDEQDIQEMRFTSQKNAELWIVSNQLGRRNLTNAMRIKLALHKETLLREEAKLNRQGCRGKPVHVRKAIAKDSHVGEKTVYKYMKIRELGTAELIRKVDAGEIKIGEAYSDVRCAQKENQDLEQPANNKALEVTIKIVEHFCGTGIGSDITNPLGKRNVERKLDKLERLIGFIGDNAGALGSEGDVMRVCRRLGVQMRVVGGLVDV